MACSSRAAALSASPRWRPPPVWVRPAGLPAALPGAGTAATSGLPDRFCWVLRRPQATSTGQAYRRHGTHSETPALARAGTLLSGRLSHSHSAHRHRNRSSGRETSIREGKPSGGALTRAIPRGSWGRGSVGNTPLDLPCPEPEDAAEGWEEEPRAPAGVGRLPDATLLVRRLERLLRSGESLPCP